MKKFLLFTFSALFAGAVSAQNQTVQKVGNAQVVDKGTMKSLLNVPVTMSKSRLLSPEMKNPTGARKLTTAELKNFNVSVKVSSTVGGPRKEIQESYKGIGNNYQTKESTSWTLKFGVAEDGTPLAINVIPVPEAWQEHYDEIGVPYSFDGTTIHIDPTDVGYNDNYHFFLHSWTSNDGAIDFTIAEDGTLTTISGEDIAYSAFSSDEFDLSQGGPYAGYLLDIENIRYYKEGEVITPTAGYEPQGLFLHPGPNVNGSYYSNVLIPAYADITLTNRTDITSESYDWSLQEVQWNSTLEQYEDYGDPITSNSTDFKFQTERGTYNAATLISSIGDAHSDPFQWSPASWYASGSSDEWNEEGTPELTFMKANPNGSELSIINPSGCHSIIVYQGKPASPLYFTGVSTFIYQFERVGRSVELTCKIHKAHKDPVTGKFELGELIAQSDFDIANLETGSWYPRLSWDNFYKEDELGLFVDVPYLILDEEFAVVFEGWDSGTFTGNPMIFTAPYVGGSSSTYAILSGKDEYTGAGWSGTFNVLVGFTKATYGYLHTEDPTNLNIPEEGGTVTITNIEPMYITYDDNENVTTALWIENEDSPEWVKAGVANEVYTNTEAHFDLVFEAEALPAGETYRTGEFVFAQRGALLKVKVSQGTPDAINAVSAPVHKSSQTFNLSGQRVNDSFKGLVIRDGQKFVVK